MRDLQSPELDLVLADNSPLQFTLGWIYLAMFSEQSTVVSMSESKDHLSMNSMQTVWADTQWKQYFLERRGHNKYLSNKPSSQCLCALL